jgi:hypothetical protein
MSEESLGWVLSRCLDRVAAGEAAATCLADYPEHASQLAPLLAAAAEVGALRSYTISDAGRQRMRAQILNAETLRDERRSQPRAAPWWRWPAFAVGVPRLATVFAVALLCLAVSTAAVAASQPGDLAYGIRVVAEQVPAWLVREPEGRARAELGIVERRLGDLDHAPEGQELDERAVAALLNSADDVATQAAGLSGPQREELAARLQEQAQHLERLGETGGTATSRALLQAAALRVRLTAGRMWQPEPPGKPATAGPTVTATRGVNVTPTPESTARSQVGPTRASVTSHTPLPSNTPVPGGGIYGATPNGPGPKAATEGPNATSTPQRSRASATPKGAGPSTPQGPGPNPTAQGPVQSATPQGPGQEATPQGPGPESTPQGPGPESTPQGPGPGQNPGGFRP